MQQVSARFPRLPMLASMLTQDAVVHRGKFISLYKRPGQRVVINAAGDIAVRPDTVEVLAVRTITQVAQKPAWWLQPLRCMMLMSACLPANLPCEAAVNAEVLNLQLPVRCDGQYTATIPAIGRRSTRCSGTSRCRTTC